MTNVKWLATALLCLVMSSCSVPKSSHLGMYWTKRNYWPGQTTHPAFYLTCRSNQKEVVVVDEFQYDHTWLATVGHVAYQFDESKEAVRWSEEFAEMEQLCGAGESLGEVG